MGVTRRIIFPALRIVIWGVIAIALVVIAIEQTQGITDAGPDEENPSFNFEYPTLMPTIGSIDNAMTLTGSVTADTGAELKSQSEGTVYKFWVANGDRVEFGAPLIVLKQLMGEDPNMFTTETIRANATGIVNFSVEDNQDVSVGDVVARIASGRFLVLADVEPHQMFALQDAPATAMVTITNGPPEFECTGFTTRTSSEPGGTGEGSEGAGSGGYEAVCAIPADITVFNGLTATIALITDSVENALLVPVTAVEGTVGAGKVWVRTDDGGHEARKVTLGLTDGKLIEVTTGLTDGEEILEFVPTGPGPGNPGPEDEGIWGDPIEDGGDMYEEGSVVDDAELPVDGAPATGGFGSSAISTESGVA